MFQSSATLTGLMGAVAFGIGDFIGGYATVRLQRLAALTFIQAAALLTSLVIYGGASGPLPTGSSLFLAALSGLFHLIGVSYLYRGFTIGRITVVTPIAAVVGLLAPVLIDVFLLRGVNAVHGAGIILAIAAVALISYVPGDGNEGSRTRQAIGLGLVSGLGYGFADICLGLMSAATVEGGLVVARSTSMVFAIALLVHSVMNRFPAGSADYLLWQGRIGSGLGSDRQQSNVNRPPEGTWNLSIVGASLCFAAGLFDCVGQFGFVLAATQGQISIAAALVALYPAITIGLGIWLLREPLSRLRAFGLIIGCGSLTLLTT